MELTTESIASEPKLSKVLGLLQQMIISAYGPLTERVGVFRAIDELMNPKVVGNYRAGSVEVALPIAYSMFDVLRAQLTNVIFQEPLLRYSAVEPDDVVGAALLEKVVDFQCKKFQTSLALDTVIGNGLKYNCSAAVVSWKQHLSTKGSVNYEGSYLIPIDPYSMLIDPSTPLHRVQDANFFGWFESISRHRLLELVKVGYFKPFPELKDIVQSRSPIFSNDSLHPELLRKTQLNENSVTITTLYVNLIPAEFGISDSIFPEKWLFCLLGDSIIIKAQPLGLEHNKFPIIICAPDFDEFVSAAPSRTGMLSGMQRLIDWLFNSHVVSTQSALSNRLIVDPTALNIRDIEEGRKFIRVRAGAVGRNLDSMFKQLTMVDLTENYYQDIGQTIKVMEKVSGADAASTGQLRQGGPERLTSTEYSGTASAAQLRIDRLANIIAEQIYANLGEFYAYNTQTMMSKEVVVKITGRWENVLSALSSNGKAKVSLKDIDINFDVETFESFKANESSAKLLMEMFKIISANAILSQKFDITKVFRFLAMSLGVKDVDAFAVQQPEQQAGTDPLAGVSEEANGLGGTATMQDNRNLDVYKLLGGV